METNNIRTQVKLLLQEIKNSNELMPAQATEYLIKLSAYLGNIGEFITDFEKNYIAKKVEIMEQNEKMPVSKVEILAQNTEEYYILQEAKRLREAVMETIRALKYRIRALRDEFEAINYN